MGWSYGGTNKKAGKTSGPHNGPSFYYRRANLYCSRNLCSKEWAMTIIQSEKTAIKIIQKLEAEGVFKMPMIEGLSEHIPLIASIIRDEYEKDFQDFKFSVENWGAFWGERIHHEKHANLGPWFVCQDSFCSSYVKTLKELSHG